MRLWKHPCVCCRHRGAAAVAVGDRGRASPDTGPVRAGGGSRLPSWGLAPSAQKLDSCQPWPLALEWLPGCLEMVKGEVWGQHSSLNGTSMGTATHLVGAGGWAAGLLARLVAERVRVGSGAPFRGRSLARPVRVGMSGSSY